MNITASQLSEGAAIVISLCFSYAPGLKTWYDLQDKVRKSLVMLAALVVVSGGLYGLACAQLTILLGPITLTCTSASLQGLIGTLFQAAVYNQATFLFSPRSGNGAERRAVALAAQPKG